MSLQPRTRAVGGDSASDAADRKEEQVGKSGRAGSSQLDHRCPSKRSMQPWPSPAPSRYGRAHAQSDLALLGFFAGVAARVQLPVCAADDSVERRRQHPPLLLSVCPPMSALFLTLPSKPFTLLRLVLEESSTIQVHSHPLATESIGLNLWPIFNLDASRLTRVNMECLRPALTSAADGSC